MKEHYPVTKISTKVSSVVVIAALFTVERMIGYLAGYVRSDFSTYPIPVFVWTVLFGITFGVAYRLICPIYDEKAYGMGLCNSIVLTLGVNWIWFNSFIGLIAKGLIGQMILRSVVDVGVIYIGMRLKGRLQMEWRW